ncbi:Txe/YoeB family addiction module toxin [Sphingomonas gilva]|uniref:Putative mRNA interferase YoeB n=1 Tax=Sphingomonas gilva TaxID=2305907 RepID=A0A396RQQ7_9SPHN|nr:Txe/YoeB family addiction module toxin [Sphingomonas gilva]RHW16613.1 Txe/YoeB family addiction module toxin [Sphingomonas gilva]
MRISFSDEGWEDYLGWQSEDRKLLVRVNALIEECRRHPFTGTGKPEPLKNQLRGWWSRRITSEHRLVYRIGGTGEGQQLEIIQCRFHYDRH